MLEIPQEIEIQHITLAERVYRKLRDAVIEQSLTPGMSLKSEELSQALGVSRTPVKEALFRLRQEGLIGYTERQGFQVTTVTTEGMPELLACRLMCELFAVRKAFAQAHLDDNTTNRIIEALNLCQRVIDQELGPNEWVHANQQFHNGIVSLSDNSRVINWYNLLCDLTNRPCLAGSRPQIADDFNIAQAEHTSICAAIQWRKLPDIEAALRSHTLNRTQRACRLGLTETISKRSKSQGLSQDECIAKVGEQHLTLAERVYREIRTAIIHQGLAPGRQLRSEQLAGQMGVSRTPIKEALSRLRVEGLVVYNDRRGFSVVERSPDGIPEIYEAMMMIELNALESCLAIATDDAIEAIRAAHQRFVADCSLPVPNPMVAYDETQAFHRSIAALGGNQIALDWYDKLEAERQGLRMEAVNAYKPEGLQIPLREHGAILQAIVSRDTDQAMTMLHEHLGNAVRVVTGWVQKARANSNQQ